jgi:hypothetical protein
MVLRNTDKLKKGKWQQKFDTVMNMKLQKLLMQISRDGLDTNWTGCQSLVSQKGESQPQVNLVVYKKRYKNAAASGW